MESIVCPVCGHFDKIEKVSAIVPHQTRIRLEQELRTETYTDFDGKSRTSTYSVPYEVVEATDLAKYLSMPSKPQVKGDSRGCVVVIILLLMGTLVIVVPFLFTIFRDFSLQLALIYSVAPALVIGFLVFIMTLIYIGASITHKKDILRVTEEIHHWDHAVKRWNRAYYCYRDGIVFIPDDGNLYASLQNAIAYFYKR